MRKVVVGPVGKVRASLERHASESCTPQGQTQWDPGTLALEKWRDNAVQFSPIQSFTDMEKPGGAKRTALRSQSSRRRGFPPLPGRGGGEGDSSERVCMYALWLPCRSQAN